MSPLKKFYLGKVGPFVCLPLTFLASAFGGQAAFPFLYATFGAFIVGNLYAEIFVRCPNCRWRIASHGRAFVRSLPPKTCPCCGADLTR